MRNVLWFLALFAMAAAVALFAGNNQGTVTLFWPPYRIDLSLNLVLLLLLAAFLLLYAALRSVSVLLALPDEALRWRMRHQERVLQQGLLDALSHLTAGRYIRARKAAEHVLAQSEALARGEQGLPHGNRLAAMAHLIAAECAHALQDRSARDDHARQALGRTQSRRRDELEIREGVQLRVARWAFDDRDVQAALQRLDELPQGVARRTLALRLRLRVTRLAGQSRAALETARLLGKHRAFSEAASRSIVRGLATEWLRTSHDPSQLQKAWAQLDETERRMPEVALQAGERMLALGGDFALVQQWLLPVWEQLVRPASALPQELRLRLVLLLERGFRQTPGQPDAAWLARIEAAQMGNPREALLQYLAGMACMHLSLWGKAQQLLRQSLTQLGDESLRRRAWAALARMAEQRDDGAAALEAWRQAAQG
ncbi:MAG: heme biosynthesis HemY N-terminal domain-containing protein [Hylemonella sp.]|nr:heme biosynthesis HemY N-terminal domain-containing protein [Hylemonella sp.]